MKSSRAQLTQADVAFMSGVQKYSQETGNGRRMKPAYLILYADRVYGYGGNGYARAKELKATGYFVMEGDIWVLMDHMIPLNAFYLPGEKPKNLPTDAEHKALAAWQLAGEENPSERHFFSGPDPTTKVDLASMKFHPDDPPADLCEVILHVADSMDRQGVKTLSMPKFCDTLLQMECVNDLTGASGPNAVSALRARLKAEDLYFFDSQKSRVELSARARRVVGELRAKKQPEPVPEPVHSPLEVSKTVVPAVALASDIRDVGVTDSVQTDNPVEVVEAPPVSELVLVVDVPREPPPVVQTPPESPAGELVRFPSELVKPSRPKVPAVFRVPGQSNPDTFGATHRHLEIRFGGPIPSVVSGALCEEFWGGRNPFPNRNNLWGGSGIKSRHRKGEKGNDWFVTERGQQVIAEYGLLSCLTDDQVDDYIRKFGHVPRDEVQALHERLEAIDHRTAEIKAHLVLPLDSQDPVQDALWDERCDLEYEREDLLSMIAGRPRTRLAL